MKPCANHVQIFNSFQTNILVCILKQKPLDVTKGNMASQRKKCTTEVKKPPTILVRFGPKNIHYF